MLQNIKVNFEEHLKDKVCYMKYADLHIHSCYSDGVYSPEEIIEIAKANGVKCISITDHDCIGSQYITNYVHSDIEIIPGIELSAEYKDIELHILGYFIDVNNNMLKESVELLNEQRIKRVEKIISNLKNYDIILDADKIIANNQSTIGRSHIAYAMVEEGYFTNYKQAFQSFLVKGKPGFEKGFKLNYKEAINIINTAGGIAVLAHPGQIYKQREVGNILKDLKCFGLKGLEVYHPSHSQNSSNEFFNFAKKYKLCVTGGSDFHGWQTYKETNIGNYGINKKMMEKIVMDKNKMR